MTTDRLLSSVRRRRALATVALGLPMAAILLLFFLAPLLVTAGYAFRPFDPVLLMTDGFTLRNFGRFLDDSHHLAAFGRTVWISFLTTVLSVLLGYPLAWHLHRVRSGAARLWLTLIVLLPLMVSLVVASFAWVLILGNNGLLNQAMLGLGLIREPVRFLNTVTGVVIVSTFSHISYAILPIFAALETVDDRAMRAARIHGATEAQAFLRVALPLSIPGVLSGALIVFALTMAAFVIPFLIGGGRVVVIPLQIYQSTLQLFDWPGAAALSILLFALTLVCAWGVTVLGQRLAPWSVR